MIAVSGAGGFIGAGLERCAGLDLPLRGLFREEGEEARRWRARGREVVVGALDTPSALETLVSGADAVIHLAAYGGKSDPALSRKVNVEGTRALAGAAAAAGVARFVHVSSISVFAATPAPEGVIRESVEPARVDRLNPYSDTKWRSEAVVREVTARAGLPGATVVRPTNVYGPRGRAWFLDWVRRLRRVPVVPGGNVEVDMVHVDDVARGLLQASSRPGLDGEILHLGHEMVSLADFGEAIGVGLGIRVRRLPATVDALVRSGREWAYWSLRRQVLSTPLTRRMAFPYEKAARLMGYRPAISWREGVADTVAWYLEDPDAPR